MKNVLLIVVLVLLVGGGSYYLGKTEKIGFKNIFQNTNQQNKLPSDSVVKSKIESYAESVFNKYSSDTVVSCSSILYGYDLKYAYALIFCGEYDGNKKLIHASNIPTRLEFSYENGSIINFKEASECCVNENVDKEIFLGKYYDLMINNHPTNEELKKQETEAAAKLN